MALTFGVIGPTDLVPRVAEVVDSMPGLRAVPLAYGEEQQTPEIIAAHMDEVDAWLFTGVVPHEIARAESEIGLPAEHVSYSGVTLLGTLFRLAQEGQDLTKVSIDTLASGEVSETLAVAGLPIHTATILEFQPDTRSHDVVEFHRQAREKHGAKVAITCLRSAYDVLRRDEAPLVRLAPSHRDIREAVDALVLQTQSRQHFDAQVALGFVELDAPDSGLERDLAELGGAVVRIDAERYLLVTTRGPLERATDSLRSAPFLEPIAARHAAVHLGLGIGRSAGDAAANASRALARARVQGDVAAVLAAPHDNDRVLAREDRRPDARADIGRLAARLGMSRSTLRKLRQYVGEQVEPLVTAAELAEAFAVQERSARRLLKRLERAGAAVPVGTVAEGQMGRPPVIYRVDL